MVFSISPTNVLAAQSKSEMISFDDYYHAMKAEYAKYGIKYEIIQSNHDINFTKELLDKQLSTARYQGEEYIKQQQEETQQAEKVAISYIQNMSARSIMPVQITDISDHTFKSPSGMGEVGVRLKSTATYDVNGGRFIGVDSYSSYQYGTYVNLKSWTVTDETCTIASLGDGLYNNCIRHYVRGLLVIEYTEPNTGLLVGYTSAHSVIRYWFY